MIGDVNFDKPSENWLSDDSVSSRRVGCGLDHPNARHFAESCEFISLGCFCATARALQSLGLKKHTYPFDWARSPLMGVVQCLDTNFEDFLSFKSIRVDGQLKVFESSCWGGSFWHHNPEEPKIREDFARRIHRLFGRGEVAQTMSRVYVRVANSSQELENTLLLWEAIKRTTPYANVHLLMIVDMQTQHGPIRIETDALDGVLFYFIHESLYTEHLAKEPDMDGFQMLQLCSTWYCEAIAFATRLWSGDPDAVAEAAVFQNISDLCRTVQQWDGLSAANSLFRPHKIADFTLPSDVKPEQELLAHAFGIQVKIMMPPEVCALQQLRVSWINNVATARLMMPVQHVI